MKLSRKAIKLLGATIASAMLVPGTIVYATSGDGLYNTFSSIYGTASNEATDAIENAIQSVIPDTVSSGGQGGSNGGGQINGIPVITYYPIGHEVTFTTPTTTTTISGNSSSSTQVTQGSTSSKFIQDIAPLESNPIGPSVNAVSLSESYHENYKVYEERLDEIYAIYTNIAAGTITNRPVIFDVPSGVIVRMTRDGKEVSFKNKEKIEKEGTYVTYFYVEKDNVEQMPAWAQTVDRATFSFRIQYTALDGSKLDAQQLSELESFADTVEEVQQTVETPAETPAETTVTEEKTEEEPKEETKAFDGVVTNTNALNCEYDSSTGYYKNTLLTGDSFYSNIPNGMITNRSVLFNTAENIRYELYKDGESVEYKAGDYIREDGAYVLIPVIDNIEYEGYYRTTRPMVRFRILNGPTSEMATMSAPFGMNINAVRFNGENVTETALISPSVVSMPEDGFWEVDLYDASGSVTTQITRDTTAPVVTVVSQPNLAEITYSEPDEIVDVRLTRGEEVVSEGVLISKVTNAGRYVLKVTDRAGNTTIKEFSVQYRINVYAVLAIVMVVAIALAVFILLRRAQTKVRVR